MDIFLNNYKKYQITTGGERRIGLCVKWVGDGSMLKKKKHQHTMPGYTNVFDYLTKVQQRSREGRNTASFVFTVRTLVRDSTSCPSLTATPGGELSPLPVLLGVIAFTLLVLKNPIIFKIIQSQFHNSSFTTFMHNYNLHQTVNKLALPNKNLCARGDYYIFCNVRIYSE